MLRHMADHICSKGVIAHGLVVAHPRLKDHQLATDLQHYLSKHNIKRYLSYTMKEKALEKRRQIILESILILLFRFSAHGLYTAFMGFTDMFVEGFSVVSTIGH